MEPAEPVGPEKHIWSDKMKSDMTRCLFSPGLTIQIGQIDKADWTKYPADWTNIGQSYNLSNLFGILSKMANSCVLFQLT